MPPIDFEEEDYSPSDVLTHAVQVQEFRVPLEQAGSRLDQVLAVLLPDYSRSRLAALAKTGMVTVEGQVLAPKARLKGNERLQVILQPREEEYAFLPEPVTLNIIYEDDAVIVINKPAGLVVHPAAGNWSGTLLNGLLHHVPAALSLPRAGIVHRLDKDTTGVMVVAKTEAAQLNLVRQLQARMVKRHYYALVQGQVPGDGNIEKALGRHPRHRTKMAVVDAGGKPALTHYRVLERFRFHTLLECKLQTGRTHQIRVHMQSIGFPLEGDTTYGAALAKAEPLQRQYVKRFGRQALHAHRLAFAHPVSGDVVGFDAPLPEDMRELIDTVRQW